MSYHDWVWIGSTSTYVSVELIKFLSIFICAYLTYDKFVHVNIKAIPRSWAIRLLRSKSHISLADSTSKQDPKWRTMRSSSSGCTRRGFYSQKDGQISFCK
jgi:hypothetical protein